MVYVDFKGVFQEKETACVKALGQENELGTFAGEKKGCGWNSHARGLSLCSRRW